MCNFRYEWWNVKFLQGMVINSKISCQEKLWFHDNVLLAVNLCVISAMSGEVSKVFFFLKKVKEKWSGKRFLSRESILLFRCKIKTDLFS